jgi:ABC-2 type transport system ATP-binding protein
VTAVEPAERGIAVTATNGAAVLAQVVSAAQRVGVGIQGIDVVEPDLEVVFLRLTGKGLRD